MSGFGAPFLTATATGTTASGVSLPAITCRVAITSASGGCTIGTSNASPVVISSARTRFTGDNATAISADMKNLFI